MKKATKSNLRRYANFVQVFGSNVRTVCPKNGVFKTKLDELWQCNKNYVLYNQTAVYCFLFSDSHPFNTSASR